MMISKRILYIDAISPSGHKLYNEILIKDILRDDVEVFTVSKEGYLSDLPIQHPNFHVLLEIPKKYYNRLEKTNPFLSRLKLFLILSYIKKRILFSNYDYIIFSSYEEISFLFALMPKNCYLISHNNFNNFNNRVKQYIYKKLSVNQNIIVLSESLQDNLNKLGFNTLYVAHGVPSQFIQHKLDDSFDEKYSIRDYDFILFSPSAASTDNSIFLEIDRNSFFVDFLIENKILLIVRGKEKVMCSNVVAISDFLDRIEYEFLFKSADVILINYGKEFQNRVSGVYYEAIANLKPVLVSVDFFEKIHPFDPYAYSFASLEELKISIESLLNIKGKGKVMRNMKIYEPNLMLKINK